MESAPLIAEPENIYALWHLPSSTLLVSTTERLHMESQIRRVLSNGYNMEDLMLQVSDENDLIGRQHLGAVIAEVLDLDRDAAADVVPPDQPLPGLHLG